jgi:hypothetical protein
LACDFLRSLRKPALIALMGLGLLFPIFQANAQYSYNPSNADEQGPGIKFFGSAKSQDGVMMADVQFLFAGRDTSIVAKSDDQGRFRAILPLDFGVVRPSITCFRQGFSVDKLTVRPGPTGARQTVQVDCVLRPNPNRQP